MTKVQVKDLEDRVAILTGAVRGIGKACAQIFLQAGAAGVVLVDVDDKTGTRCARELDPSGELVVFHKTDVSNWKEVQDMVADTAGRFGRIDILVNSAAIVGKPGGMETHTAEELDRIWAINVKGVYFTCKAVRPHMLKRRYGRVVNIASIAGKEGNPGLVPYSTTKAAVIGFTKAYAKEVANTGILVNSIAPAVIETEMLEQVSEETRAYMISKIPMGRVGQPEEVAELVYFLSSDRCSFSTGFCYDISGGRATY